MYIHKTSSVIAISLFLAFALQIRSMEVLLDNCVLNNIDFN